MLSKGFVQLMLMLIQLIFLNKNVQKFCYEISTAVIFGLIKCSMNLVILFQVDLLILLRTDFQNKWFLELIPFILILEYGQLNMPKVNPLLDCIVAIKSQRRYWIKTVKYVKYLTSLLASFGL